MCILCAARHSELSATGECMGTWIAYSFLDWSFSVKYTPADLNIERSFSSNSSKLGVAIEWPVISLLMSKRGKNGNYLHSWAYFL